MSKPRKDLSPEDELRLLRLRSRSDAMGMAYFALERDEWGSTAGHDKDEVLLVVKEIMEEQDEAFVRARREAGISD